MQGCDPGDHHNGRVVPRPVLQRGQQIVLSGRDGRRFAQPFGDLGIIARQQRQQFVADAVAGEGRVGVALVQRRLQVRVATVGFDGRAGHTQQRPQQPQLRPARQRRGRRHAPQPGRARAAQQVEQHRFGLVAGVVADDHGRRPGILGHTGQKVVARGPAGRLQRDAGRAGRAGQRDALAVIAQAARVCFAGHGRRLVARTWPQAVVEVSHDEPLWWDEAGQDVEQGQRIGAAGDADD